MHPKHVCNSINSWNIVKYFKVLNRYGNEVSKHASYLCLLQLLIEYHAKGALIPFSIHLFYSGSGLTQSKKIWTSV